MPGGVYFGALVPSLVEQGFEDKGGHFQSDADALVRLNVRGLLPDAQTRAARQKLTKRILAAQPKEGAGA